MFPLFQIHRTKGRFNLTSGCLAHAQSTCPSASPGGVERALPAVASSALAAWWGLALFALGVSTLCALVLVVARTPFLGLGAGLFRSALVLHVDLAVVVWFLAAASGLWSIVIDAAQPALLRLARLGALLSGMGVLIMLLSPFVGVAEPVLANYVPILDSYVFSFGLFAVFAGVSLSAAGASWSFLSHGSSLVDVALWKIPLLGAVGAYWIAMLVFLLGLIFPSEGASVDDRFWGAGHVLQVVHTMMLMAAWLYLAAQRLGYSWGYRVVVWSLVVLELAGPLVDLYLAIRWPLGSIAYRLGFTEVMRWLAWPAPFVLAFLLLGRYVRLARFASLDLAEWAAGVSICLFIMGCVVGMGIRGETTVIPAHYHGTVGAVTLAYMLWIRRWQGVFGLQLVERGFWRWQPFVYGSGIALLVGGLAWAGWLGVIRKAPHADILMDGQAYFVAMGIAGVGGVLATCGAGGFVLWLGAAISQHWRQ